MGQTEQLLLSASNSSEGVAAHLDLQFFGILNQSIISSSFVVLDFGV